MLIDAVLVLWLCVLRVYKPISSDAERRQYKRDFGKEYAEYLDLHKKTEQRMLIFSELSGALKQCLNGSSEYEVSISTLFSILLYFVVSCFSKMKWIISKFKFVDFIILTNIV